jgi:hypothetical protein
LPRLIKFKKDTKDGEPLSLFDISFAMHHAVVMEQQEKIET